jgi:uncharacterized protein (DUF697 family)
MGSISSSVVRVRDATGSAVGAGFLVDQRHIVTCAHVVRRALDIAQDEEISGERHVTVEFPFLRSGPISMQTTVQRLPDASAEPRDIAGLSLDGQPPEDADPVRLVTAHPLWGHPFRVVGFPSGYQERGQWASGYLRELVGGDWLQIEGDRNGGARVRQGFSGAPVWDEHLMGTAGMVVAADREDRDRVAYMIPASSLVQGWSEVLAAQSIPPCPYRGLRAFSEDTAEDFYGRDADVQTVLAAAQHKAFTTMSGPSGCGKSSLLAAGVVPAIREAGSWLAVQMRPGADPFTSLAQAISGALEASPAAGQWVKTPTEVLAMLPKQSFQDFAAELLRQAQRERLLLVVDQFEELCTLVRDTAKRDDFVRLLMEIARGTGGVRRHVTGLVAIRADYEARVRAESPALERLLTSNIVRVPPMGPTGLREAIVRPAERAGVSFEEGLPERIIKDFQNQPNALPMLQVLLMLLWETQQERTLAVEAYLQLGGVEQALTDYANRVYDSLTHDDQTRARRVLLQLVGLAEGSPQTRRPLLEKDVRPGDWAVVQRLADQRLLSMDHNQRGETFAELVHESLSWSWERLHEWIIEAEQKLRRSDEEADRIARRFSLGAGAANLLPPPLDTMAVASTLALMGRRMAKAYGVKINREVFRTAGISMAQGVLAPISASWGGTELLKAVPGMSVWVGLLVQPPIVAAITYAAAETWKYYFHVVSAGGRGPDNAGLREFIRLTLSNRIRQVKAKINTAES